MERKVRVGVYGVIRKSYYGTWVGIELLWELLEV